MLHGNETVNWSVLRGKRNEMINVLPPEINTFITVCMIWSYLVVICNLCSVCKVCKVRAMVFSFFILCFEIHNWRVKEKNITPVKWTKFDEKKKWNWLKSLSALWKYCFDINDFLTCWLYWLNEYVVRANAH